MHNYFGGHYTGWLFWVIILGVILFFAAKFLRKDIISSGTDTPLEILKKRYAKGEITKEEFEKMKKEI